MRKPLSVLCIALLCALAVGCAAGPNPQQDTPDQQGLVAGFWRGLWHGAIAPVTFVISLFNPRVEMYEVHNSGGWYDFGFLIGIGALWGGGAARGGRVRWRK